MDRENQDPERGRYLTDLERSLRERVQQEEQETQRLQDEVAELRRLEAERERVRAARRAYVQELQRRYPERYAEFLARKSKQ